MNLTEAFAELNSIYEPLTEGRSMPYALLVLNQKNEWKVYKGLDAELTNVEAVNFLKEKPEYKEIKVVPSSDISKYVKKDSLDEAYWYSRAELISMLKDLGRQYNWDKYSDKALYTIWVKEQEKAEQAAAELELQKISDNKKTSCDLCNEPLTDAGECPRCDLGDNLDEGVFDGKIPKSNWVKATSSTASAAKPSTVSGNIVTIVADNGRLRARADDGTHGPGWVAFPNNLRNQEGQQYEVDNLVWNGKNYRATGQIKTVNSVVGTQNIKENINKENYEMNFQSILEELDSLYEELPAAEAVKADTKADVEESCDKPLKEADEEILIDDEPIIDDEVAAEEVAEDEPKQLVLECSKCGALVIKAEADVTVDEASDLVNVEEECAYCEETAGFKVIGNFLPTAGIEEATEEEVAEDETTADEATEEVEEDEIVEESVEKTEDAEKAEKTEALVEEVAETEQE
jgi:hypothetical protein